jgi:restriction endonuclease Mrr
MMRVLIVVVLLAIIGLAGFSWIMIRWSYASGDRAGFVQKLSRRGYLCKTWEGEMAMVTMPGTVSEKFLFTVPDDATASKINASLGKRVSVHYEQHKWIPNSCFGETEYFVTGMQVME